MTSPTLTALAAVVLVAFVVGVLIGRFWHRDRRVTHEPVTLWPRLRRADAEPAWWKAQKAWQRAEKSWRQS